MKLVMLGCGTSTGVPRVGNDWGACDPAEPKNRRTRVSVVLRNDTGQQILIDTSPDCRQQLLDNSIDKIDAVFWTHDHADHCHGIDDLRPLRQSRSNAIPGFADPTTARRLRKRFDYVFAGQYGYPSIVDLTEHDGRGMVAGFTFEACEMPHGGMSSTGFRFEADGRSIGYATDFAEITPEMIALFDGADILVADCLRRKPHPTHAHLDMALELRKRCGAAQLVLTHLDKSMDYATLHAELAGRAIPGYDGLELEA